MATEWVDLAPGVRALCGDFLQVIPQVPQVDCIITDPPYWTLNKWREIGTTTRLGGHRDEEKREGWFRTIDPEDLWECVCTFGLLLPKNGHAWIMADDETSDYVKAYVKEGETPFGYCKRYPVLKMTKDGAGYRQGMGYHGRASHEYIVLLEKGRRRFSDENWPDVFSFPWTGDAETRPFTPEGKPYPTAKPTALYRRLIELSTAPGETVLDPFCGGGALAVAALETDRKAVCIDVNPDAIETTRRRLATGILGGSRAVPVPVLRRQRIPVRPVADSGLQLTLG